MDKIQKELKKLTLKEYTVIKKILEAIVDGKFEHYDLKKLKGRKDIYRIRKGRLRIIFHIKDNGSIYVLTIERRIGTTYKKPL